MNRPECIEAMRAALDRLGVDLGWTDIFATHCHSDHVGLVSWLKTETSRAFLHPADAAIILDTHLWSDLARSARIHGFPDADHAVEKHPGKKYLFTGRPEFTPLREGDILSVGQYRFRCIETPGHTPGHLCLYEPTARLLFSGDHILDSITPNISGWAQENDDPLGDFQESLDKVAAHDIALVLPGHRNPIHHNRRRISELQEHPGTRTQEVVTILARGGQTAYEVASRMTWDISYKRWEDFPVQVVLERAEAEGHAAAVPERAQAQIDAVDQAIHGGRGEQLHELLAQAQEKLRVLDRPCAVGLAVLRVPQYQIDIRRNSARDRRACPWRGS